MKDKKGHIQTELVPIIILLGLLVTISLPEYIDYKNRQKEIKCLKNIVEIIENNENKTIICPVSNKPYPPKSKGVISCPDPDKHLKTNPHFVLKENQWTFSQNLPQAKIKSEGQILVSRGIRSPIIALLFENQILLEEKTRGYRFGIGLAIVIGILGMGIKECVEERIIWPIIVATLIALIPFYVTIHGKETKIIKDDSKIIINNLYFGKVVGKSKFMSNIKFVCPIGPNNESVAVVYKDDEKIRGKILYTAKRSQLELIPVIQKFLSPDGLN